MVELSVACAVCIRDSRTARSICVEIYRSYSRLSLAGKCVSVGSRGLKRGALSFEGP